MTTEHEEPAIYLAQQASEAGGPMISWSAWATQAEAEYACACMPEPEFRVTHVFKVPALGRLGEVLAHETCAACGSHSEGTYSIHRDGFGEGPEVPLCTACGSGLAPTCEELWARIAVRRAAARGI